LVLYYLILVEPKVTKLTEEVATADEEENDMEREGSLTNRLRNWMEIQHRLLFFIAGNYHMQAENSYNAQTRLEFSNMEDKYYESAQSIRLQILLSYETTWNENVARYFPSFKKLDVLLRDSISKNYFRGGILCNLVFSDFDDVYELMNEQMDHIRKFRFNIMEFICSSLDNETEREAGGDEFEKGVLLQDEVNTYMDFYPHLLACRREVLTGASAMMPILTPTSTEKEKELHGNLIRCKSSFSFEKNCKKMLHKLNSLKTNSQCIDQELQLVNIF
jgi:hypothetical protein